MTDVIERAQAWLDEADERGINLTNENGYLAVIHDLLGWCKELADDLGKVEKARDVLARTVNDQERELGLLRVVRDAALDLCDDAEEYECEGLGLFAQHGSWEPLHDALEAIRLPEER